MNLCDKVSWLYFVKISEIFFSKIFPTVICLNEKNGIQNINLKCFDGH